MYVNGCEIKQLVPFSPERSAARQPAITCKQLERRAGCVTVWGTPCVTMWGTQLSVVSLERRAGCVTVRGTPCVTMWGTQLLVVSLERRAGCVTVWGTPCVTMWGKQLLVVSLERRAGCVTMWGTPCVTMWGTPWFRGSTSAQRPSPSQREKSASCTASVEAESTALRSWRHCTATADQIRAFASFQRAFPAPIHHEPIHHAAGTPRRGWSSG